MDTAENTDSRSDNELIDAVNQGDFAAFEVLYLRHRDWVVAQAYRFTGQEQLALDVLQETFLYFLKKFPGFTLTARLQTFLYPAIRNLSIAARRKVIRFQGEPDTLETLAATTDSTPQTTGEELSTVLETLSEEQREVLLLRFVEGFSLNEIAEALEIPLGTVKSRLHNALTSLRKDERTKRFFDR